MQVLFKKVSELARLPVRATEHAAGYDIHASESIEILPHESKLVKTGFAMEIPAGYEAQVRPRSGLALKNSITVINTPGTIDADYRGEVGVILINHGNQPFVVKAGDRIAQMIFAKHEVAEVSWVDTLTETQRNDGGFGHTKVSSM